MAGRGKTKAKLIPIATKKRVSNLGKLLDSLRQNGISHRIAEELLVVSIVLRQAPICQFVIPARRGCP